jgi:hypothetical protein
LLSELLSLLMLLAAYAVLVWYLWRESIVDRATEK